MSAASDKYIKLGVIIATLSQRILPGTEQREFNQLLERLEKTEQAATIAKLVDALKSANSCLSEAHRLAALLHLNLFHLKWQRRVIPSKLLTLGKKTFINEIKQLAPEAKLLLIRAYLDRYGRDPIEQLKEISKYRAAQRLASALDISTIPTSRTPSNKENSVTNSQNESQSEIQLEKHVKKLKFSIRARKAGAILSIFQDADQHFRTQVIAAYAKTYSPASIASDLKRSFRKLEAEIIEDIIYLGEVAPAKLLYCSVAGIGTDEASIRMVLQNSSPQELEQVATEFYQIWEKHCPWFERFFPQWFGDLYRRLMLECGGDCWFDLSHYFNQAPNQANSELHRLWLWYEHEKSGSLVAKGKSEFRDGQLLAERASRAKQILSDMTEVSEEEKSFRKLETIAACSSLQCELEIFRDRKHLAGNTLSAAISAPIATSTLLSLGALGADLWKLMIGVGVASGGARILLKNSIKGRGYHREELSVDLLYSVLDGITLFANRIFRHFILRSGTRFAAKLTFRLGLSRSLKPVYLQAWLKAISERSTVCDLKILEAASAESTEILLNQLREQSALSKV